MEYGQHGPRGRLVPSFVAEALVTGPGIATILHRLCWVMTAWEKMNRLKYATIIRVAFKVSVGFQQIKTLIRIAQITNTCVIKKYSSKI